MKVIKFLFLTIFSFAVISCSNIYNQGDASLEICLPGSPDSDARFIDIEPGMFNQNLSYCVYQIVLDGPIHLEKLANYGESCVFENLVCGRYKLSVYTWTEDPYSGSQWNQLYCYGEKDIAVFSGKNTRAMDIYALNINNIEEITGASITMQILGDFDDDYNPILPNTYALQSDYEPYLGDPYCGGARVWYKGGYSENYDDMISLGIQKNWVIYKNGKQVCKKSDFNDDNGEQKEFILYPKEGGYEIIFTYKAGIYETEINVRALLDFEPQV